MNSSLVNLHSLRKRFGRRVALDGVSLSVAPGERLSVLGPSGCGKTTLLRVIAGLEQPDDGRVEIDGRDVTGAAPHQRGVTMVMQSGALYPHLRVRANIEFPLRMLRMSRTEIDRRVSAVTTLLDIDSMMDRAPATLSGGERQRVALARSLAHPARILLLDEPFTALDAPLRTRLRQELRSILDAPSAEPARTVILVTHDQEEAIVLGHRIAVMDAGRLLQVGTPEELLHTPASRRVAAFIGSPLMGFVPVTLRRDETGWRAELRAGRAPWQVRLPAMTMPAVADGAEMMLGLRGGLDWCEAAADSPHCDSGVTLLRGTVIGVEHLGGHSDLLLRIADGVELVVRRPPGATAIVGMSITFSIPASALHLFRVDRAGDGDGARLAISNHREEGTAR